MNHKLSIDEYNALELISKLPKNVKPNACIGRNTKRLSGIKLVAYRKDGSLELTETGRQVLFIKQCIDGLRAIAADGNAPLMETVATFLSKKGHIETDEVSAERRISARGIECLADIDANMKAD
ncbi:MULTISPECIES: hypothetical protein [unclassified Undibacterium]|uniref:hypothetical protein n=1 Tax=unclassified Undibacterium TaxID=2630295 RepID=UPI002AC90D85|nr:MULTISPECIES: hypothetical protein [unclassified Undibacterium]MEB0139392.1 hypothetical protein [Undibacterium sp. CCC2.1]MEB0173343.1 hypothetical protein [Undibacterium sp. CCC1.1]MEB0177270.1 hypothetical protein [Undibacterium sp. CCC3.4]MEB0216535.1 hypothetical protein [Undibacterium sp. 5I2]WPX44037.1 hypothetical protein RHM61_02065 [Undibacterium sp. CCC3.4]